MQVIPKALRELPTKLPPGVIIACVSERYEYANNLLIPKSKIDESQPFKLPLNARLLVPTPICKAQMQAFRADLKVECLMNLSPLKGIELLNKGEFEAMILSTISATVSGIDGFEFEQIAINPRELIVDPGQGFVVFLTSEEDIPTRRFLKQMHKSEVVPVVNSERRLKQLFKDVDTLAAHCYRDNAGNFHLQAAALIENELRIRRVSQTTAFEIAERCYEQLMRAND
ncbi:MAG: hypothetical protein HC817_06280 [Saprospiraceae bacterium]|nr:hypothetical protein [Saprospiraceae bacterium]